MTVLRLLATQPDTYLGKTLTSVVDVIEIDLTDAKSNRATLRRHYNRRWSAAERARHTVQFEQFDA